MPAVRKFIDKVGESGFIFDVPRRESVLENQTNRIFLKN